MKKISVIVPVFNSEKYLKRCVESILNQSYNNLEVLLIDNNSTDQSLKICQEYEKKDNRVRVFIENKSGPSCARNRGITEATGDLLAFVDSDDYLDDNMYEVLVKIMTTTHSQMVVCSWKYLNDQNNKIEKENIGVYKQQGISANNLMRKIAVEDIKYGGGFPWNRLIDWDYIRKKQYEMMLFDESLSVYEDKLWLINILKIIDSVVICDYAGYNYYIRDNSLSHTNITTTKCENYIKAWNAIISEFPNQNNSTIEIKYCDAVLGVIFKMFLNGDKGCAKEYWNKYRKRIIHKSVIKKKKNIVKIVILDLLRLLYRGEK